METSHTVPFWSFRKNSNDYPLFIEFDKPKAPNVFIRGQIYSFENEKGEIEYGKFIEEKGGRIKLEKCDRT